MTNIEKIQKKAITTRKVRKANSKKKLKKSSFTNNEEYFSFIRTHPKQEIEDIVVGKENIMINYSRKDS